VFWFGAVDPFMHSTGDKQLPFVTRLCKAKAIKVKVVSQEAHGDRFP
jgi:hypothetical protein